MIQNSTPVWAQTAIFPNSEKKNRAHKTIWLHDVYGFFIIIITMALYQSEQWWALSTLGSGWPQGKQCLFQWTTPSPYESFREAGLLTNVHI